MRAGDRLRPYHVLSALLAPLALAASVTGIAVPSIYRDAPIMRAATLGQDLVTAFVGVPLLVAGLVFSRRGSPRGHVIWLGAVGYLWYAYATAALGLVYNDLFLLYVVILGLASYAFAGGLVHVPAEELRDSFDAGTPTRPLAVFMAAIGAIVGAMWLSDIAGALIEGVVPDSVAIAETTTNVIYVFDLALVLPAFFVAAVQLWRRRAFGYLLAGVLLVKAATICFAVVTLSLTAMRAGEAVSVGETMAFAVFTAASLTAAVVFFRHQHGAASCSQA